MNKIINLTLLLTLLISCSKDDFNWKIRKRPCILNQTWNDGDYYINLVEFESIFHQSGVNPYHEYNRDNTASLNRGSSYTLKLGYSFIDQVNSLFVYFDWNSDGDFNDQEEVVYQGFGLTNSSLILNVQVPNNAKKGYSTMRILVRGEYETNIQDPCYDSVYGEAEDYQIKIY
jgi:hypothetical protein